MMSMAISEKEDKTNVRPQLALREWRRVHSGYLMKNPVKIALFKSIDLMGGAIAGLFGKSNGLLPYPPRKILLARIDHLGDVLMSLQVLPAIKSACGDARIDFVCGSWSAEMLKNNPLIGRILIFDHFQLSRRGSLIERIRKSIMDFISIVKIMREEHYDLAVDLREYYPNLIPILAFGRVKRKIGYPTGGFGFLLDTAGNWREGIHQTEHFFDLLKLAIPSVKREQANLDYLIDGDGTSDFLRRLDIDIQKPFILVHAFCHQKAKTRDQRQWRIEEWKRVIRSLDKKGIQILCTGESQEKDLVEKIIEGTAAVNCAGLTSIPVLAGLIKGALCVVCVVTFTSHLSGAIGAKTFVLFNDAFEPVEQWRPWGVGVHVLPIESRAEDVLAALNLSLPLDAI